MQTQNWTWTTPRLTGPARLKRWGHFGTPVLIFPTAGGDFDEIERFHLLAALEPLIAPGRIKVYSLDGLPIRAWLRGEGPTEQGVRFHNLYDAFLYEEVVPRIRSDCLSDTIELVAAGASLGALTAVLALCRHPDAFRVAVGLSGVYELARLSSPAPGRELYFASPLTFLPALVDEAAPILQQLRGRFVALGTGEGDYETPAESRRLAGMLEAAAIPHELELWGVERDHEWRTWQAMLPNYLARHA